MRNGKGLTSSRPLRRKIHELLYKLGADEVIDYSTQRFENVARDVDVVLDPIGGETQERSWKVLRAGGILLSLVQPPSRGKSEIGRHSSGNADRQSALALVSWRTGFAWAQVEPKSKNEARAMVEKGRDILRQLKERTGSTADQQGWLDAIEADLRKMQEKKGATGAKVR